MISQNKKMIFLSKIFSLLAIYFLFCNIVTGQKVLSQKNQQKIIVKANEVFGKSVTDHPHLYSLGNGYGVLLFFGTTGELERVSVYPLSEFLELDEASSENQIAPSLSTIQFDNILNQVSQIRCLGELQQEGHIGFSSGGKVSFWNRHTNAYVEKIERIMFQNPDSKILGFNINYFSIHIGKIKEKEIIQISKTEKRFLVNMNGKKYLIRPEEFKKIKIGSSETIDGAEY